MGELSYISYGNVCFVAPQKREKAPWHESHEKALCLVESCQ